MPVGDFERLRRQAEPTMCIGVDRWNENIPVPIGCVMDEFGRVWRVTYMQEWSTGKRQFTVEPVDNGRTETPESAGDGR